MNGEVLATIEHPAALVRRADELSVEELVEQVAKIQQVMKAVMRQDTHYGVIPGTPKPTLYKAGAEKLCLLFRLDPEYQTTEHREGDHLTVQSICILHHIPTAQRRGSGMGSCSTRESKYAYRSGSRKCPNCSKETIIKGKEEYGGGWLCFAKKGGCGSKFKAGDKAIEGQPTGRVPNDDLPDSYNTVLKMANKRSLVAAVLNVTAASDIFTQDLEDLREHTPAEVPRVSPHGEVELGKVYRGHEDREDALRAIQEAGTLVDMKRALNTYAWSGTDELENWHPDDVKEISRVYKQRERILSKAAAPMREPGED